MQGQTAFDVAARAGHTQVAELLQSSGSSNPPRELPASQVSGVYLFHLRLLSLDRTPKAPSLVAIFACTACARSEQAACVAGACGPCTALMLSQS